LKHFSAVVVLFTCFAAAAPAAAQTMQFTDKGYVTVNLAGQVGSHTLDTNFNFPLFDETATVNSSQKVSGGFLFDIGGAYRVWGNNLLAGVSYSHTSSDADVAISGSIPDPVFFDRPTTFERTQGGAKHSENAVHISAIWMIPVANKTDVALFAGPSIFFVKQQTIGTPTVSPGPVVDTSTMMRAVPVTASSDRMTRPIVSSWPLPSPTIRPPACTAGRSCGAFGRSSERSWSATWPCIGRRSSTTGRSGWSEKRELDRISRIDRIQTTVDEPVCCP